MNLIEKLKPLVTDPHDKDEPKSISLYGLNEVAGWPEIKDEPEEGEDENETEPLDLENVELIKLDEEECIVWGGGDWQQPRKVTIRLVNEIPTVVLCEDGGGYNDHNFLGDEEVDRIFNGL